MSNSEFPNNDRLLAWVEEENWSALQDAFRTMHVADIAEIIMRSDEHLQDTLFGLVSENARPDVLAELHENEQADDLIEGLSDEALSDLAEEMQPDDAADVIGELDAERTEHVLELMEEDEADEVRILLAYEPESAGGIMTTEVVALHQRLTIGQALQALAELDVEEPYNYLYTVDRHQVLTGVIGLWELIRLDKSKRLMDCHHVDPVKVRAHIDQEQVANLMRKYDLTGLPVVQRDGRLIGRVTIDDAMDVMEDEATEDMLRMAGTDEADLTEDSPWAAIRSRLPWLLITLVGGCLTSLVMDSFFSKLSTVMVLSLFIPMVMAMGGNTGIQTSIVIVRSLALGTVNTRTVSRMLLREIKSGMVMGLVCGILMAAWVPLVIALTGAETPMAPLYVGAIAGFSLWIAMAFAGLFGCAVPLLFQKIKIDPAVASGPLVIVSIDILSLAVYFLISMLLVGTMAEPVL